jgi:biotin operon repressor
LKLNVTQQLLVYVDDLNPLGDNINIMEKNIETVIDASKEVGVKVDAGKYKYMLLFRRENAGKNYHIKIANRFFENVAQLKYLERQ